MHPEAKACQSVYLRFVAERWLRRGQRFLDQHDCHTDFGHGDILRIDGANPNASSLSFDVVDQILRLIDDVGQEITSFFVNTVDEGDFMIADNFLGGLDILLSDDLVA